MARLGPNVVSIADLRVRAKRRLPRMVFDYIDGGAGDEKTMRENSRVFDDFLLRPVVDGMALLLGTIPGTTRGPAEDELPIAEEQAFVPVSGARPSARRTLTVPGGTLAFVGLHRHGVGLVVRNPLNVGGNLIPAPPVPTAQIFALTPGANPATDDPNFEILP